MKSHKEIDYEINCKIDHLRSINNNFNLKNLDNLDKAVIALELFEIVIEWGLHTLPLRVLNELDKKLSKVKNNQKDYIYYESWWKEKYFLIY